MWWRRVAANFTSRLPTARFSCRPAAPSAAARLAATHFHRPAAVARLVALGGALIAEGGALCLKDEVAVVRRQVEDDYELGDALGEGSFAVVRKGRCRRTGKEVAVKVVPKSRQSVQSIRNECKVLQRVSLHRCIASLEAFYETEDCFFIVMEFVNGGDLFDRVANHGAFTEPAAARLLLEVAGALALLHAQGMVHADIKPENMLLTDDGHIKLVDFGLSCEISSTAEKSDGTLAYWAPELFTSPTPRRPMDMWALGVVLFIMLTGEHPFDSRGTADNETLKYNIRKKKPDFSCWTASTEARKLTSALLNKNPEERLTIEELLQHPWLVAGGVPKGSEREVQLHGESQMQFQELTSKLRAACFAIMLQQQAAEREAEMQRQLELREREREQDPRTAARLAKQAKTQKLRAMLRRQDSFLKPMIASDLLTRAFREFDAEGKGYITEADLQRVLKGFGRAETELQSWLQGAAGYDREGRRVTFGNYIRMMSHTIKQSLPAGAYIFSQGDPVRYFYCLLDGEVEVVRRRDDGTEEVLNRLHAGEYFGENSLLSGNAKRSVSMRCASPVEILKLSKTDFEAGFGVSPQLQEARSSEEQRTSGGKEMEALRAKLIGFILMVSRTRAHTLQRDQPVFREGDAVDHLYVLTSGALAVQKDNRTIAEISAGEAFGEISLLEGVADSHRSKTVSCASDKCEVVSILGSDFLRLVEKSKVVRESFEHLKMCREKHNAELQAKQAN